MMESNEFRGVYRIDLEINVPAAATPDGRDRFRENKIIPITTWLTLRKDAKHLQVKTKINNDAKDHRLRVNFPSNVQTDTVDVESAFAVENRDIRWTDTGDNFEKFYEYQPMQGFVDVSDGKVGLAVLNRGLREYEVKDDSQRTIAITLIRTHRAYMTANAMMTPDELDQYPGQHGIGTQEYEYALYPHAGNWLDAEILKETYNFKVDINAIQAVPHSEGKLPSTGSFISVDSDKLMLACLKQADDGDGVILRYWNISDDSIDVTIDINLPVKEAYECMLNENVTSGNILKSGKIKLTSGPHKINTLLLKF
jgi:alpha-mannosidase